MEKVFIKNRDGKKLAVVVEQHADQRELAFVMHGQGGFKEQPHVRAMCEALYEQGCTVVSFDAANTVGESEGRVEDSTVTSFYADLEDVISWGATQPWYQEPFILAGHSLGGISIALFAENFPNKVLALAPLSTVISGSLSRQAMSKDDIAAWQRTGWLEYRSKSRFGTTIRIAWNNMEDLQQYNLLTHVDRLTMPVLMAVGESDKATPLEHQRKLHDELPGDRELHVIKGAPHTFREPEHLAEIQKIISHWAAQTLSTTTPR